MNLYEENHDLKMIKKTLKPIGTFLLKMNFFCKLYRIIINYRNRKIVHIVQIDQIHS